MSGLTSNNEYGHLEIDWTYTRPEHKHKGYMQELFAKMLNGVYESVYCVAVGVYQIMRKQICIRLCLCSVLKKLYNQGCIGKYHIIVFVIMKVAVRTVQVLIINAMKICFYERIKI